MIRSSQRPASRAFAPRAVLGAVALAAAYALACSDEAGAGADVAALPDGGPASSGGGGEAADAATFASGSELLVPVAPGTRTYVKLDPPAVVVPSAGARGADWDLAFEGWEVFTNSGPSGGGAGGGFGPLGAFVFLDDVAPAVPFVTPDEPGGAFKDWYLYEGAPAHALWNRFHVYAVEDGERLFKVQLLGYYAERDGAPVSALYGLRWAELFADRTGEVHELAGVDATAGGASAPASAPSACLDLGGAAPAPLLPAEASASAAWHVCLRRQNVSVNGGAGGPRGVRAADLDRAATASESLATLKARTPASERARFDAVGRAEAARGAFRADGVVSVFTDAWADRDATPPAPVYAAWLVVDAAGARKFLVAFTAFDRPTEDGPGTVALTLKPVKG